MTEEGSTMNPLSGNFGVPDYVTKKAMQNVAAHAAIGTGAAADKQKDAKLHKNEEHHESVQLSAAALQDTENSKADQAKQAGEQEQELARADQGTKKAEQQGSQKVSGHAAMALGSKDEKTAKEKELHPDDGCGNSSLTTETMEEAAVLNEADTTGILDEMAKKLRGKDDTEKSREKGDFDEVARHTGFNRGTDPENTQVFKPKELSPEEVTSILNRDPESILKDVPTQFRTTANMMVAGQMPAEKPNKALTQLKQEPRVECAALELDLLATGDHPIMDISVEAPPIPDLTETQASV